MSIDADFTYIDGLEIANPTTGDPRSAGDDHLRGIKTAVKGSFPNIGAAAVTSTAAELSYTDVTALGTCQTSKCVTTASDGSIDFNDYNLDNLDIDSGNIAAAVVLANGIAATTQGASDNTTKLATTAYVDTQTDTDIATALAAMRVTSTAQTTYASGTNWTYAHSKASVPDLVLGYGILQATHTDGGYSAGDRVFLNMKTSGSATEKGLFVWADSTNLGGVVGENGPLCAYNKTTGALFDLAVGEWDIHVTGVWFT